MTNIDLAAVTGGNAAGNGQTGDRYRSNPNDNGTDPSTRGGLLGSWGGSSPQLGSIGGAIGKLAGQPIGTIWNQR